MIQRIQSMKNKKGFTLVELIVVLVILVILAAIAVPSFVTYIDKAKAQGDALEARAVYLAAKSIASENYGSGKACVSTDYVTAITALAGDDISTGTVQTGATYDNAQKGAITKLQYTGSNGDKFQYNTTTKKMEKVDTFS